MKNYLLWLFAIIGFICVIAKSISFFLWNKQTNGYYQNCSKVQVGMTLYEAREAIGDLKYEAWTQDNWSAEIVIHGQPDEVKEYVLEYDMLFGGSDNMKIYFDPNTLLVTEVFCGE